jgi:hypothetical protein
MWNWICNDAPSKNWCSSEDCERQMNTTKVQEDMLAVVNWPLIIHERTKSDNEDHQYLVG